jgi:multidrug efflux pump subunit AcrA (membrane-fusion protein)
MALAGVKCGRQWNGTAAARSFASFAGALHRSVTVGHAAGRQLSYNGCHEHEQDLPGSPAPWCWHWRAVAPGGGASARRPTYGAVPHREDRARANLQATVSASGAVNPVTQVSVGTQVSGQIRDLYVDFNSEVRAGQLIAQIDPETFEYRVRSSQADVDAARAAVLTAQATASASRAQRGARRRWIWTRRSATSTASRAW